MGITLLTTATMALFTAAFGAPVADGGPPGGNNHINPHTGGNPGHFWHIEDSSITWPTHKIDIVSNITQDMPGWNPTWASEGGHGGPNTNTKVTAAVGNGILGHVINQCSKTIYVRTAIGPNDGVNSDGIDDPVGGTYAIAPGAWYTTTIRPVINGKSGVSVKLSDSATTNVVYQIEYAQKANGNGNMAIWYDLSGLDGNPFGNEKRYMQVNWDGNACENLYNAPGSTGMDWLESNPHTQKECENVGDVYFWLC
ncbi:hypothetical protein LTR56_013393 [Elasticomyces elasticus]|nr:hypothetical protein LTR56_013393 [Elasticomyces elasticus]KAK3665706.1 hypothetical protein LTR22_003337 [Elasticomyces elasticus]KAK4910013.1 hypothetical protein LTR49_021287 [Elasticomyces elasticus]KAK5757252.1 hypothetical protein LTS12_012610 [Elasticomyces elasticus]